MKRKLPDNLKQQQQQYEKCYIQYLIGPSARRTMEPIGDDEDKGNNDVMASVQLEYREMLYPSSSPPNP